MEITNSVNDDAVCRAIALCSLPSRSALLSASQHPPGRMACLAQIARGRVATWTVRLPALPTSEPLPVRLPPSSERAAAPGPGPGETR